MERYRRETAARVRRRRRNQMHIASALIGVTACIIFVTVGAKLVNERMNNPVMPQTFVMPTQLPSLTPEPETQRPAAPSLNTGAVVNDVNAWQLILVNRWHSLPENYAPVEFTELANGQSVDKRMYPSLQEMFDDARNQGIYPYVRSGYRTAEAQRQLLEDQIAYYKGQGDADADALARAEATVGAPGTSEHETGLAIDINADTDRSSQEEVNAWMAAHCHEYGFILRYPEGKTEITGMQPVPNHFRYVGNDAADAITEAGICLEEYLGILN